MASDFNIMEFETRTLMHDGHRIVYDVYGAGDRVLLYMHGLLLDSELNRGIAAALAERGNRVVLVDLLGHGRSEKPAHAAEYRIDAYANQAIAVLDELGVERAAIGGVSLGANVSLFAATQNPERVTALVLEMPVLEWAVPAAALAFVPIVLAAHYGRRILGPLTAVLRRLPRTPFGPLNSFLNAGSTSPDVIAAVMHGVLVGPVAPTIDARSRIEAPTLVLAHANDMIHPFDDAARLTRRLPRGSLVRTTSPLELRLFPQRLTESIARFLEEAWDEPRSTAATPRTSIPKKARR